MEMCPNNKCDASTLVDIIERHVQSDTTIMTDCWKGYDQLDRDNWTHPTVNHSMNFVDQDTEAHTQGIENTWWQLATKVEFGNNTPATVAIYC